MDFSKFDSIVDLEGLRKDIEDATKGASGEYAEVPLGSYEVAIEKMELTESKKGDPMVAVWFKIINGDYENSRLFMNQVITKGFQIHIVNNLLRSLGTSQEIEFKTYQQYADLLMDVHEEAVAKHEYAIEYGENKGYKTFKVIEVFDIDE